MKKWLGVLLVVVGIATLASADTLELISYTSEYGPYTMSLNNGPSTSMICMSDQNFISVNESWPVVAFTISQINSLGPGGVSNAVGGSTTYTNFTTTSSMVQAYNIVGYLANELFANPHDQDLQDAIWYALGLGGSLGGTTVNSDYTTAYDYVTGNPSWMTGDIFYLPECSAGCANEPQAFVGIPEPGSLLLLGAGFLGGVGVFRRKWAAK